MEIVQLEIIKTPYWDGDTEDTLGIPKELTIGSRTWTTLKEWENKLGGIIIENNKYGVDFDPTCFKVVQVIELKKQLLE